MAYSSCRPTVVYYRRLFGPQLESYPMPTQTNMHVLSGIQTGNPYVYASRYNLGQLCRGGHSPDLCETVNFSPYLRNKRYRSSYTHVLNVRGNAACLCFFTTVMCLFYIKNGECYHTAQLSVNELRT